MTHAADVLRPYYLEVGDDRSRVTPARGPSLSQRIEDASRGGIANRVCERLESGTMRHAKRRRQITQPPHRRIVRVAFAARLGGVRRTQKGGAPFNHAVGKKLRARDFEKRAVTASLGFA